LAIPPQNCYEEPVFIFVSAGLLQPKKYDTRSNRLNRYLNYPLVGLATISVNCDIPAKVIHGNYDPPQQIAASIPKNTRTIMLSLPSAYSIPWARSFTSVVRRRLPGVPIIAGGRWVVDGREDWIKLELGVDAAVPGMGEEFVCSLAGHAGNDHTISTYQTPDYTLMDDYRSYQPSLEVNRGCGHGCNFCTEADEPQSPLRSPLSTARELRRLCDLYSGLTIHPYLQSSLFQPNTKWIRDFARIRNDLNIDATWRTEARADTFSPAKIEALAECGMRVIDIGLESGSPGQLLAMGKTRNPTAYLAAATRTLDACAQNGVLAKLNIVLYPGESSTTIHETTQWLEARRNLIAGISANPFIFFPTGYIHTLSPRMIALGASLVDDTQPGRLGYGDVHLSATISNLEALRLCHDISSNFMTLEDYFNIKSFGYFQPGLTLSAFRSSALQDAMPVS
jgi:hypothetical protein